MSEKDLDKLSRAKSMGGKGSIIHKATMVLDKGGHKGMPDVEVNKLKVSKVAGAVEYVGEAQEFADMLKKKWRGVKYDAKRGVGSANIGGLKINFHQSGNDSAVIVTITDHPYMKGDPTDVMKALDRIKAGFDYL